MKLPTKCVGIELAAGECPRCESGSRRECAEHPTEPARQHPSRGSAAPGLDVIAATGPSIYNRASQTSVNADWSATVLDRLLEVGGRHPVGESASENRSKLARNLALGSTKNYQRPQADQISEQQVSRLAEWPGTPWLVRDIGLQLLPPQVGIEAIVVMTRIAARR